MGSRRGSGCPTHSSTLHSLLLSLSLFTVCTPFNPALSPPPFGLHTLQPCTLSSTLPLLTVCTPFNPALSPPHSPSLRSAHPSTLHSLLHTPPPYGLHTLQPCTLSPSLRSAHPSTLHSLPLLTVCTAFPCPVLSADTRSPCHTGASIQTVTFTVFTTYAHIKCDLSHVCITHTHAHTYACTHTCTHTHARRHPHTCTCTHVHTHAHTHVRICMCECM